MVHQESSRTVVAVDATALRQSGNGISRFVFETVRELASHDDIEIVLISNKPLARANTLPVRMVIDDGWSWLPGTIWLLIRMSGLAKKCGASVIWGPGHLVPLGRCNLARIVTVHDLVVHVAPESMSLWGRIMARLLFDRASRIADIRVADSEATRSDLAKYVGIPVDRTAVVHLARTSFNEVDRERNEPPANRSDYFFTLGSLEPRKNIDGLIRCFDLLLAIPVDISLRLAGSLAWKSNDLISDIKQRPAGQITRLGFLLDEDVRQEMRNAKAFVMPSHYEGFGLPLIEAVGLAPIIAADIPVFRELAYYIDPIKLVDFTDPDHAAQELAAHLAKNGLVAKFINGGENHFRWSRVADDYALLFRQLAKVKA